VYDRGDDKRAPPHPPRQEGELPSQLDLSAAFYTADRDLVILSASQAALSLWGKSPAEVIGFKLLEVFPFLAGSEILAAHLEALRTFRPVRFTTRSHFLSGTVDVEIYPVADGLQVRYWQASSPSHRPDLAGEPFA
jgi:PAS domain-containing protein